MNIRERILARPDLAPLVAERELDKLADALNAEGLTEVRECWVDALGIMNRCANGKSIVRKLRAGVPADAVIEIAWRALVYGKGLDFGADSTRSSIDEMAAPLQFTAEEVGEMKALAVFPIYVTRLRVEAELFKAE